MHRQRNGFTLIELLVVIAIIAILAAILFPVFARARDRARQATCSSNMRQIGLAIMMYLQDYDETFPGEMNFLVSGDSGTRGRGWYDVMAPYTTNEEISVCPTGWYELTRSGMPNPTGFWGRSFRGSYAAPAQDSTNRTTLGAFRPIWANYYPPGIPLATIVNPSGTVMLFESTHIAGQNIVSYGRNNDGTLRTMDDQGRRGRQHFRHNGMMNVLFGDGHVKVQGPAFMADLDNFSTLN